MHQTETRATPPSGEAPPAFAGFPSQLFSFLRELERHNERAWMDENRARFEEHVRDPSLRFVRAVAPRMASVCPQIAVSDRRSGGAMLRMNRDTRFSASKRPYHTSVVLQFPHAGTEPRWAPGCSLRLTSRAVYVQAGMRIPGAHSLNSVRTTIDAYPEEWAEVRRARGFRAAFEDLDPPELARVPPGWPADHPFAADLRRKHFLATRQLVPEDAETAAFLPLAVRTWRSAAPLLRFLCDALGLPWDADE